MFILKMSKSKCHVSIVNLPIENDHPIKSMV